MIPARGKLITLEGIEGSGKTTQWRRLIAELARAGYPVVATREPGGTGLGALVRAVLLDPAYRGMDAHAELLLYCADRAHHVATLVAPALERGSHVICDRFSDATRAYQGFGRGLGLEMVDRVNLGDLAPALTLLLDLPVAAGLTRARRRNRTDRLTHESRFEEEDLEFHARVRTGYLELARRSNGRIHVLDGDRGEDQVFTEVLKLATDALGAPPEPA